MEHGPLTDIAVCIVAAWLFGVVAQVLRQPVLLAYLVAGFVIGPHGIGVVTSDHSIESISGMGLILLLFVIGLEIDLKRILGAGRPILVTGAAQILGTILLGLGLALATGMPLGGGRFDALYFGVAMFVSSTVIAVKILTDKRELDTLAGRITVGLAVLQDVAVIIFLGLQPALGTPSVGIILVTFAKIGILIGVALGVSRYILPPLFHRVATLPELVVVGAISWCFIIAALADRLGLSREMGALVAGVAISTFPYHLDVTAKVASLRDFFITLFFVGLGMTIPFPEVRPVLLALAFCVFLLLTRFLTVMVPLRALGMGNRVGFLAAINLLPLSEFSLVILTLGIKDRHVHEGAFAPVVYTFLLLAAGGSYLISQSGELFQRFEPWLHRFGLGDDSGKVETEIAESKADIFLLGFSWTASSLLDEIQRTQPALVPRLAVIDFNPEVHHRLVARGVRAIWGDISQRDTLEHAGLGHAKLVLCTLPNVLLRGINNLRLVQLVRSLNPDAAIIAHAELLSDVPRLKAAGAAHVNVSRLHDADELLSVIEAADKKLLSDKLARLESRLASRDEVVP